MILVCHNYYFLTSKHFLKLVEATGISSKMTDKLLESDNQPKKSSLYVEIPGTSSEMTEKVMERGQPPLEPGKQPTKSSLFAEIIGTSSTMMSFQKYVEITGTSSTTTENKLMESGKPNQEQISKDQQITNSIQSLE